MQVDVAIVGAGAAGVSVASSLLKRDPKLNIAIFDPSKTHLYQPGWTLVGAGVLKQSDTVRDMASVIPSKATWVQKGVQSFTPEKDFITLADGSTVNYKALVVAPGIKLNYEAIEGLPETLGRNGVSSNYRYDLTTYTWECLQKLEKGTAIFTQPPMPIKCAGAPQKILYLACDYWMQKGVLGNIDVQFRTAGAGLFGVKAFVPTLMTYMEKYGAKVHLQSNLIRVNGDKQLATFSTKGADGAVTEHDEKFDFLHVVPYQCAQDFMKGSPIADANGFVNVDKNTLQHVTYKNVFSCGDGSNAPTSKTAAAIRKQAPVVASNVTEFLSGGTPNFQYNGYTSCPLTVSRSKAILAEFGYGGELMPTFPFLDPTVPRAAWWQLKAKMLIPIYFELMLKGRELLIWPKRP